MGLKYQIRRIKRAIDYAIIGFNNEDYDWAYLDELVIFKMKRILKQLEKDSSFVCYEDSDLKSLRLAIKIGERLSGDYFEYPYNRFVQKWGPLDWIQLEPTKEGNRVSTIKFRKVTSPTLEERCDAQQRIAMDKIEKLNTKYNRLFSNILLKYKHRWWS